MRGPDSMVWIPAGEFLMGSDHELARPNERPTHLVRVAGFWMDRTHVTNAQFAEFVQTTGYVTTAEKPIDAEEILKQSPPGTPRPSPEKLAAGSLVFQPTPEPVKDTRDVSQWWHWTPGASWRNSEGPGSSIAGRENPLANQRRCFAGRPFRQFGDGHRIDLHDQVEPVA